MKSVQNNRKFIIVETSVQIGGVEILLAGYAKYIIKNELGEIIYISKESTFNSELTNKLFGEYENQIKILLLSGGYYKNDLLLNLSKYQKLYENDRRKVSNIISDTDEIYIITCYFPLLQYSMELFKPFINSKIFYIWPHPLDWINDAKILPQKDYTLNKFKNRKVIYQSELLEKLHTCQAMYYASRSIFDFNNWFYETDLNAPNRIECLPVSGDAIQKKHKFSNDNILNVLWVGRFTYFKNDAIVYIFEELEQLSEKYPDIRVTFNIVGAGEKKYFDDLKNRIKGKNVTIKYWGTILPEKLPEIFAKNDIGISMGLTVKTMALNGLPAILIDSLSNDYKSQAICNWIYDVKEGDAGDGMYYWAMGKPLKYRDSLGSILENIIHDKKVLELEANKCYLYVKNNYSEEKQYRKIYEACIESKFHAYDYYTFKHRLFYRVLYELYKYVRE
ncbi:hypothetical protein ACTQWG_10185 [Blautia sp. HCP3S3_H10_1]|uniref:hypothetical protein n=1 Tax=unclassified Blautia TaxID=2648079 RepID=UPI003F8FCD64